MMKSKTKRRIIICASVFIGICILCSVALTFIVEVAYHRLDRGTAQWHRFEKTVCRLPLVYFPRADIGFLGKPIAYSCCPTSFKKDDMVETADEFLNYFYINIYTDVDTTVYASLKDYYQNAFGFSFKSQDVDEYAVFGPMNPKFSIYDNMKRELDKYCESAGDIPALPLFDIGRLYNHEHTKKDSTIVDYSSLSGLYDDTEICVFLYENWNILKHGIPTKPYVGFNKDIRHGFTVGVAFYDEKRNIYYWMLAW